MIDSLTDRVIEQNRVESRKGEGGSPLYLRPPEDRLLQPVDGYGLRLSFIIIYENRKIWTSGGRR